MSGVRDPAFWRRFSVAVHRDEESGNLASPSSSSAKSSSTTRSALALAKKPELKHTESWLDRQQKKESRRIWICWMFWVCMAGLITGVVIVILWLQTNGMLGGKHEAAKEPESTASAVPGMAQGTGA